MRFLEIKSFTFVSRRRRSERHSYGKHFVKNFEARPEVLDKTDAIFGTSVGSILALLLASGYDPEECEEIFRFLCLTSSHMTLIVN